MKIIYYTGIALYGLLIRIAALFGNKKAGLWVKGQKGLIRKIEESVNSGGKKIWMHCASLGEYEQGKPVLEEIKRRHPEYKIVLTFFSPSGYEIRKNDTLPDYIFYLPLDGPKNARRFIKAITPEKVFFVKYEFWYYYLNEMKSNGIDAYLISANFRSNQIFFKKYGGWYRSMLKMFSHLFVQNERSVKLLESAGIKNVSISGDTRFDRVSNISKNYKLLPEIEAFAENSWCIVAGSTWPPDEAIIVQFLNQTPYPIKAIIAPHEIDPARIQKLKESLSVPTVCYSEYNNSERNNSDITEARIIIIDSIGILSSIYRFGKAAFIGGGFGKGIHNTLEAATYGIPVLFGPYFNKFEEAVELVKKGGAFSINELKGFSTKINSFYNRPELQQSAGEKAGSYVKNNTGATEKILEITGF